VARYFGEHFVAAHQQVGSFEVVNQFGVLQKNGGNVASYFCTTDGRVIHAVTGPVSAKELLAEAQWAVARSSDREAGDDPERIAAAHREAVQADGLREITPAQRRIHQLLAQRPLPPLNEVYRTIFEDILGQRVSRPDTDLAQADRAFAAARRARLPILLILHKGRGNKDVLGEWDRYASAADVARGGSLADLARSYVVVALPLAELPALSHQLGIPPYAAPDGGSPLFVVARSDARQLSAVTSWNKADELAYAMAQGIVQEAKEHDRTPEQLQTLLAEVGPIDAGLAGQVRRLLGDSDPDASLRAGASKVSKRRRS
jgi:hypothetical protein